MKKRKQHIKKKIIKSENNIDITYWRNNCFVSYKTGAVEPNNHRRSTTDFPRIKKIL